MVRQRDEAPLTVDDMLDAMPDCFDFKLARQHVTAYKKRFMEESRDSELLAESAEAKYKDLKHVAETRGHTMALDAAVYLEARLDAKRMREHAVVMHDRLCLQA